MNLQLFEKVFQRPLQSGALILERYEDLGGEYISIYINTPQTMAPSGDNDYVRRLLIMREADTITEAELIRQAVDHLTDQLRAAWQTEAAGTWTERKR